MGTVVLACAGALVLVGVGFVVGVVAGVVGMVTIGERARK